MNSKQNVKSYLFLFLFLLITSTSFSQDPLEINCFYSEQESDPNNPLSGGDCSHNGDSHTPDGTLRVLVVFCGFEGYQGTQGQGHPPLSGWNNDISIDYELPNYVNYDQSSGIDMSDFLFSSPNDFTDTGINPSTSVSNTFHLMSKPNRNFKLIGSPFTGPNGTPRQVVVPIDGLGSWEAANRRVVERMIEIWEEESTSGNPEQDIDNYFSQFDQRDNNPDYDVNNVNSQPDGIIDVVAYIWRYDINWSNQP